MRYILFGRPSVESNHFSGLTRRRTPLCQLDPGYTDACLSRLFPHAPILPWAGGAYRTRTGEPSACKADALPTELMPHVQFLAKCFMYPLVMATQIKTFVVHQPSTINLLQGFFILSEALCLLSDHSGATRQLALPPGIEPGFQP